MSKVKLYKKRGSRNYKENKLIRDLEPIIEKRMAEDPEFKENFRPAESFDELKDMHNAYASDDAVIIDEQNAPEETAPEPEPEFNMDDDDGGQFVDPMNRNEPQVRDYVQSNDSFDDPLANKGDTGAMSFDEPMSFDEAFVIPEDDEPVKKVESRSEPNKSSQGEEKSSRKSEPVNPSFDSMSGGKKRKSTKKFAKYIVETVCMLGEKGFVWFANKDINESKLAEYEINGEMDLNLLLTMPDNQEATVRQFFQAQCIAAEQLCKFEKEEKEDLAAALAEVLLEKGVAPTPTQELLLITLKIFGEKAIMLMALKSQTNAVLNQLRALREQELEANGGYTPRPASAPPPSAVASDPTEATDVDHTDNPVVNSTPVDTSIETSDAISIDDIKGLAVGEEIQTVE